MGSNLTALERQVLGALIRGPDAPLSEKTIESVVERTGLSVNDVTRTLWQLADLDPEVVHREIDARTGQELWFPMHAAIEALERSGWKPADD